MSGALVLAFGAGSLAALGVLQLASTVSREVRAHAPRLARGVASLADVLARLGREGRDPGAAERRRLLLLGALVTCAGGALAAGPLAGAVLGAAGPWIVSRLLRARREHYRRAVEDGAAQMAMAIADALGGGHSLRGAIGEASRALGGPAGHELRRVASELEVGARTDLALEAMGARARSHRIDTLVAACLLQRRAGGDLARLLRDSARAFDDQARLEGEVRAATAQARFTGLVVFALPLGGALLSELASPGFLAGLAGSFLTAWLVGIALVLQLIAAVVIRRLGAAKW